ncbi:hypothetical protein DPEC_G00350800 [Dallia pectoralis]|uniref:Uncharacterized protein n=1 Tax=Dallia pectoralis TaxID=75939 RepID=A0ACC2F1R5_DALPE|nr:hypothetical protein DPEC_G00350800 [Dallia pectoralis]
MLPLLFRATGTTGGYWGPPEGNRNSFFFFLPKGIDHGDSDTSAFAPPQPLTRAPTYEVTEPPPHRSLPH